MSNNEHNPFASLQIKNFPSKQDKKIVPIKTDPKVTPKSSRDDEDIFLNNLGAVTPLQEKKAKAPRQKSKANTHKNAKENSLPQKPEKQNTLEEENVSLLNVQKIRQENKSPKNLTSTSFYKDLMDTSEESPLQKKGNNPFVEIANSFPQNEENSSKKMLTYTTKSTVSPPTEAPIAEEDEFFHALKGVTPLNTKGRDVAPSPPIPNITKQPEKNPLVDFMDGKLEFSLCATDEFIQGHIVGLDMLTLGKLQARQYSPEAHIDLHGLNSKQAYENLIVFFRSAYQRGLRTLLVVTGRGLNSVNHESILRPKLQEWLTHEPFRRVVLAFCSAKQEDGGAGAIYVLIRKRKKNMGKIHWDTVPTDPDLSKRI